MTKNQLETAIYGGINVELRFEGEKPTFGDLFAIRGFEHPNFPMTGRFNFAALSDFEFDQVDDYFGIRNQEDEGDDVKVWLSPMINGGTVYHCDGPFDSLRLSYGILRNPPANGAFFLQIIAAFAKQLPVQTHYPLRDLELGNPPDLPVVEADIAEVVAHWRNEGIEPGSEEAMLVSF